jgi:hypothetical protein
MSVVMRVQPDQQEALRALMSVLQSIESVRNARALYLLMLAFAGAGMLFSMALQAMARESALAASLWAGAAFLAMFYASNAAGLVVMDEARGLEPRQPLQALQDALRTAHRLLVVVLVVLAVGVALLAAAAGLLWLCRLPKVGPALLGLLVPLLVPGLGLSALAMVMLVGTLAAPGVWAGLGVVQVLQMLLLQVRRRLAHATLLAAAVSLAGAAMAGVSSFVVLAGGRMVLALGVGLLGLEITPEPFLAALFGQGLRTVPGAPALSAHTAAAISGAGVVFALGLLLPGVVYLRGLCEVFLALRRLDAPAPMPSPDPEPLNPG